MTTIIAQLSKEHNKIITELIEKLPDDSIGTSRARGGNVLEVKSDVVEDILFGAMMDSHKTGKMVSKNKIMRKLRSSNHQ